MTDATACACASFRPKMRSTTVTGGDAASSFLTSSSMAVSCFFGAWTIREVPLFGGGSASEYQFTFAPFALESVLHEPPHIVAPADGATVDMDFPIEGAYASGATPGSRLISRTGVPSTTVDFAVSPLPQATMHVDLTGATSNQLTVWAGSLNPLGAYFSPVTPVGTPGPNHQLRSEFRNVSSPVTVTVVPEPSTIALVTMACGML